VKTWRIWGISILTAAVGGAVLLFVASMRYAMAPVDPPRPSPDYGLQALISYAGIATVIVVCATSAILANRQEHGRGRVVGWGCVIALLLTAVAAICALTIPSSQ